MKTETVKVYTSHLPNATSEEVEIIYTNGAWHTPSDSETNFAVLNDDINRYCINKDGKHFYWSQCCARGNEEESRWVWTTDVRGG